MATVVSVDERDVQRLLLRLGELGARVSAALSEAVGEEMDVGNLSVILLCRLDLEGPMRPAQIAELEEMTSGGASKLIDRMETSGLVVRMRDVLASDRRAVHVDITERGRILIRRMSTALLTKLGEEELLIKEINELLA